MESYVHILAGVLISHWVNFAFYLWLYSPLLDLQSDSLDGGSAHHKASTYTYRIVQTQNKCTLTSMPQVGF
jgi:hypothetical protein